MNGYLPYICNKQILRGYIVLCDIGGEMDNSVIVIQLKCDPIDSKLKNFLNICNGHIVGGYCRPKEKNRGYLLGILSLGILSGRFYLKGYCLEGYYLEGYGPGRSCLVTP